MDVCIGELRYLPDDDDGGGGAISTGRLVYVEAARRDHSGNVCCITLFVVIYPCMSSPYSVHCCSDLSGLLRYGELSWYGLWTPGTPLMQSVDD